LTINNILPSLFPDSVILIQFVRSYPVEMTILDLGKNNLDIHSPAISFRLQGEKKDDRANRFAI
jgi:hypothetical protein